MAELYSTCESSMSAEFHFHLRLTPSSLNSTVYYEHILCEGCRYQQTPITDKDRKSLYGTSIISNINLNGKNVTPKNKDTSIQGLLNKTLFTSDSDSIEITLLWDCLKSLYCGEPCCPEGGMWVASQTRLNNYSQNLLGSKPDKGLKGWANDFKRSLKDSFKPPSHLDSLLTGLLDCVTNEGWNPKTSYQFQGSNIPGNLTSSYNDPLNRANRALAGMEMDINLKTTCQNAAVFCKEDCSNAQDITELDLTNYKDEISRLKLEENPGFFDTVYRVKGNAINLRSLANLKNINLQTITGDIPPLNTI